MSHRITSHCTWNASHPIEQWCTTYRLVLLSSVVLLAATKFGSGMEHGRVKGQRSTVGDSIHTCLFLWSFFTVARQHSQHVCSWAVCTHDITEHTSAWNVTESYYNSLSLHLVSIETFYNVTLPHSPTSVCYTNQETNLVLRADYCQKSFVYFVMALFSLSLNTSVWLETWMSTLPCINMNPQFTEVWHTLSYYAIMKGCSVCKK